MVRAGSKNENQQVLNADHAQQLCKRPQLSQAKYRWLQGLHFRWSGTLDICKASERNQGGKQPQVKEEGNVKALFGAEFISGKIMPQI